MNRSASFTSPICEREQKPVQRLKKAPFLPLRPISVTIVLSSLLLGIALASPAILFFLLFPTPSDVHRNALKSMMHPGFVILTSIIIGPLLEELVYRGLFLQLMRRYMRVWTAIILSSSVFAVTHLTKGPVVAVLALLMSCLFGWMLVRTGSLYPGLLCHVAFNFAGFSSFLMFGINEKLLAHTPGSIVSHSQLFPAWWIVLSIVMAAASVILLRREFARQRCIHDVGAEVASNRE